MKAQRGDDHMIWPLPVGLVVAIVLAIPLVSVLLFTFTLCRIEYVLMIPGVWTFIGPSTLLVHLVYATRQRVSRQSFLNALNIWIAAVLIHCGASYGKSHWRASGLPFPQIELVDAFYSPLKLLQQPNAWRTDIWKECY
jgi:hypothetical protein